jgi:hypothetical protein
MMAYWYICDESALSKVSNNAPQKPGYFKAQDRRLFEAVEESQENSARSQGRTEQVCQLK